MTTSDSAFSINTAVCLQAHQAIASAARGIEEALNRIDSEGAILLSAWEGEAREAFLTRQTKWNADADVILQKLRQINAGLEQAVHIYDQADKRGAQMIAGG
jgi:early secretory antigenic target protein ESAT-6